jgi:hypothetical protein
MGIDVIIFQFLALESVEAGLNSFSLPDEFSQGFSFWEVF